MHDIYDLIHAHRSVRRYRPDPVPEEMLRRILGAAVRASSSGNMQAYSVIATTDAALKQELRAPHFYQEMVTEAPVLLTFCADFHRMRRWLELSEAPLNFDNFMSFMIASIDAILASQNAALAAEAEGLGICYMGTTLASCAEIARILECPRHVVPVVGFSLGYPDEAPVIRDRLPLDGLVHRERYTPYPEEEIQRIYDQRETAGMRRYREVPGLQKRMEEAGARNLAQVYTKAKYTRESHLRYSRDLFGFLQAQDFMNFD